MLLHATAHHIIPAPSGGGIPLPTFFPLLFFAPRTRDHRWEWCCGWLWEEDGRIWSSCIILGGKKLVLYSYRYGYTCEGLVHLFCGHQSWPYATEGENDGIETAEASSPWELDATWYSTEPSPGINEKWEEATTSAYHAGLPDCWTFCWIICSSERSRQLAWDVLANEMER